MLLTVEQAEAIERYRREWGGLPKASVLRVLLTEALSARAAREQAEAS